MERDPGPARFADELLAIEFAIALGVAEDDDVRLASMIADYLREHQFEVTHAANAAAALASIKTRVFDAVLEFVSHVEVSQLIFAPDQRAWELIR